MNNPSGCNALITAYGLKAHPEGGYYKEIHRSGTTVVSPVNKGRRNAVTHIYFLLCRDNISRFHKVSHDEIWNFYEGAPLNLICFGGRAVREKTIGPGCRGYTAVVKGGTYQAAQSTGEYSLMGCTVAPGFDFNDFAFLKDCRKDLDMFLHCPEKYHRFL